MDDNFTFGQYQNRQVRIDRFNARSNDDKFYVEFSEGGMLCPNEFVAHKTPVGLNEYFICKRRGITADVCTIKIRDDGKFFQAWVDTLIIPDNFAFFEANLNNTQRYPLDQFIENLQKIDFSFNSIIKFFTTKQN